MYICIYCHGLLLPLRPVSSRLVSSRFSPFFSTLVPWPADAFSKSVSMRIRPNPIRRRISYIVQSSIVAIPPVSVFKRIQQSGKKEKTLLSCSRSTRFLTPLTSRAIRSGNPQTRSACTIFQYLFSLRSFFLLFPHPLPSHSSYDFFVSTDGSDRETRYITRTTESPVEERGSIA